MWVEEQTLDIGRPLLNVSLAERRQSERLGAGRTSKRVSVTAPAAAAANHAAVKEAFERGVNQGREGVLNDFDAAMALLKRSATSFQAELRRVQEAADQAALKLALEIAAKLLEREVSNPEVVREVVLNALKQAPRDEKLFVRVNPEDMAALDNLQAESGSSDFPASVVLASDPEIERGGCVIQSPTECLDAQMKSRLELIARELSGVE